MSEMIGLGGIQELRGQEEGEGVSKKSTLNLHVDQNLEKNHHCALNLL